MSDKPKHTIGPWRPVSLSTGRIIGGFAKTQLSVIVVAPDSQDAFKICGMFAEVTEQEVHANAQLVAAAPELLEACERAADEGCDMTNGYRISRSTLELLVGVIARAKGAPDGVEGYGEPCEARR